MQLFFIQLLLEIQLILIVKVDQLLLVIFVMNSKNENNSQYLRSVKIIKLNKNYVRIDNADLELT